MSGKKLSDFSIRVFSTQSCMDVKVARKIRVQALKMYFYRRMLRILSTHQRDVEQLQKNTIFESRTAR